MCAQVYNSYLIIILPSSFLVAIHKLCIRDFTKILNLDGWIGINWIRVGMQNNSSNNIKNFRYPHLTAVIFKQLVILTSGDNKEVSRISGSILSSTLTSLPFIQSMTLVNNVIKNETKEKVVAVLKRYNDLLMVTNIKLILEHKKDIMTGLIKVISNHIELGFLWFILRT